VARQRAWLSGGSAEHGLRVQSVPQVLDFQGTYHTHKRRCQRRIWRLVVAVAADFLRGGCYAESQRNAIDEVEVADD